MLAPKILAKFWILANCRKILAIPKIFNFFAKNTHTIFEVSTRRKYSHVLVFLTWFKQLHIRSRRSAFLNYTMSLFFWQSQSFAEWARNTKNFWHSLNLILAWLNSLLNILLTGFFHFHRSRIRQMLAFSSLFVPFTRFALTRTFFPPYTSKNRICEGKKTYEQIERLWSGLNHVKIKRTCEYF